MVSKIVRIEISIGDNDKDRDIDQFIDDIKSEINNSQLISPNNITVYSSYYIVNGKVCLPKDFDVETKTFKPNTYPPRWAGGPDKSKLAKVEEPSYDEGPREFVHVSPTKSTVRDPMTGRRIRSDKGKKRGPRKKDE